jgi:hypothetical protein
MAINFNQFFINPIGLTFEEWATRMYYLYPNSTLSIPPKEEEWRTWAEIMLLDKTFESAPIPSKDDFPHSYDWERWAIFLVNYLIS